MRHNLPALVVILALSVPILWAAGKQLRPGVIDPAAFTRRCHAWVGLTAIAFLAPTFWLFILLATVLIVALSLRDAHRFAMYLFLLLAVPPSPGRLSGLGLWSTTIGLDPPRLLALVLLLPCCLAWHRDPEVTPLGKTLADRCVLGFCLLTLVLSGLQITPGATLQLALGQFVDIVLPYCVASRALRTQQAWREALVFFVLAVMLMIPLGWVEQSGHWLLYEQVAALGAARDLPSSWRPDSQNFRAMASAGHPSILGYLVVIALCLFAGVRGVLRSSRVAMVGWVVLLCGLCLSPRLWLSGLAAGSTMYLMGRRPVARGLKLLLGGTVLIAVLIAVLLSPVGSPLADWLSPQQDPHFSTADPHRLLEVCLLVIPLNPFFGAPQFLEFPIMQHLKDGNGDMFLTSAYVGLTLTYGFVGLGVYLGMFLAAWLAVRKARQATPLDDEGHRMGRALQAALLGSLLALFGVGSVQQVVTVQMILIGLCAGHGNLRPVASSRSEADTA